jgi:tRNA threonylcarbamoyl adenosine modification protein YjeE
MIDLIVDAGKLSRNKPSTVVDLTGSEIKVLRRGDLITGSTKQTLISGSEKETEKIAEFLLKKQKTMNRPLVFLLSGELGCGKTVFSRKIGRLLGVKDKITSPTFVIYNEYTLKGDNIKKFLHMDLYKITTEKDLEEIKILDLFEKNSVSCIEWPENMGRNYLKKLKKKAKIISVNFNYLDEKTREIQY